jgi:glucokinase
MKHPSDKSMAVAMGGLFMGLDVGGTKCAALLGNARGEVLNRSEWASHVERGPEAMIADFLAYARNAPPVTAVGVSIGCPLDSLNGVVLSPPNLPGWNSLPLKARLEQDLAALVVAMQVLNASGA